jgi:hypothetical protein
MRIGTPVMWTSLLALTLLGCDNRPPPVGDDAMEKRIADLERKTDAAQEQNRDLRAKMRAVHVFGRSPLGDFFAAPEFWECTYDSSWSDCSKVCSDQTRAGSDKCKADHPEGPERVACIEQNTQTGAACLKACPVQMSPVSPLSCGGGAPM